MHAEIHTEMTLLYGAMDESELLFRDILLAKARDHPNFKVVFYLNNVRARFSRGSLRRHGLVP